MSREIRKVSEGSGPPDFIPPPPDLKESKESKGGFSWTKYEILVYILAIIGIGGSVAQIVFISMDLNDLHDTYTDASTFYLCGMGIALQGLIICLEIPMIFFVRKRAIFGIQHWMFANFLILMIACTLGVVAGGVYKMEGLFLSLSFVGDIVRIPIQMFLVHKFVKSEKLNEDSHYIAAYSKKFNF